MRPSEAFQALQEGPASASPHPATSKAAHYSDRWEQGRRTWATSISHTEEVTAVALPSQQRTPAAFITEEANHQHRCQGLPAEFLH